jgi:hypothetical protein
MSTGHRRHSHIHSDSIDILHFAKRTDNSDKENCCSHEAKNLRKKIEQELIDASNENDSLLLAGRHEKKKIFKFSAAKM